MWLDMSAETGIPGVTERVAGASGRVARAGAADARSGTAMPRSASAQGRAGCGRAAGEMRAGYFRWPTAEEIRDSASPGSRKFDELIVSQYVPVKT